MPLKSFPERREQARREREDFERKFERDLKENAEKLDEVREMLRDLLELIQQGY